MARWAAEAETLDARNDVEYSEIPCKTLLSSIESRRVPFEFNLNPYRGCEFGCVYCYARYTHEFLELDDWRDFERRIYIKTGAADALREDLHRRDYRGRWIAIGTATDPYQPAERRLGLMREILGVLETRRGLRISITTKSDLVTRDIDLLRRINAHSRLNVNLTITTMDHHLSRRIEPRAPRPDRRMAAVSALGEAGISAGVFLMPLLPRINDRLEQMEQLVAAAAEAGAAYVSAAPLYLRSSSAKRFFPFLEEEFPELVPLYRRLFTGRSAQPLREYSRARKVELDQLRTRYGLPRGESLRAVPGPDQLTLPQPD